LVAQEIAPVLPIAGEIFPSYCNGYSAFLLIVQNVYSFYGFSWEHNESSVKPCFGNSGLEIFSDFGAVIAGVLGGTAALVTAAEGEFLLCLRATLQNVRSTQPPIQ